MTTRRLEVAIQPAKAFHRLVCPKSHLDLREMSLTDAEACMSEGQPLVTRTGQGPAPVGRTETLLVREDNACAYPVVSGIPMLLAPEMLLPPVTALSAGDLSDPRYAEAYTELDFYNHVAARGEDAIEASQAFKNVLPLLQLSPKAREAFPSPRRSSIDTPYDPLALWDAYSHVAPLKDKTVLQLGGAGSQAVKFLLAGAREAWVISPMVEELLYAQALAGACGVAERLHCVGGVAEELPFQASSFDVVFSGGSLHHTVTTYSLPETARVLSPGGKFAAMEPWRAPLYSLGIRLIGKREAGINCRPMTPARAAFMQPAFKQCKVRRYGALTRYPLLALWKFGLHIGLDRGWQIAKLDDAITSRLPVLKELASSAAILGTRGTT